MPRPQRLLLFTGTIAVGAVILYSWVIWGRCAAIGMTAAGILGKLSTYFTILTNILLGAGCLMPALAPDSSAGRFFRRPGVSTALLLYIGTVGAVYAGVLQSRLHPHGRQQFASILLHYVTPPLYLLCWMRHDRKIEAPASPIPWTSPLWWLLYPLTYLLYILIRARFTGEYPYPFIDLRRHTPLHVTMNVFFLCGAFLLTATILIFFTRERKPRTNP